jgi:hypothetical protein
MVNLVVCNFQQFIDIIDPLIEKYGIEKNERLTLVVTECYERLKLINGEVETSIGKLINELIQKLTDGKRDDEGSRFIHDICIKIAMRANEMQKSIDQLKESNETLKTRMDLGECFNYSFDLTNLFIYYYIAPHLKTMGGYKVKFNN